MGFMITVVLIVAFFVLSGLKVINQYDNTKRVLF